MNSVERKLWRDLAAALADELGDAESRVLRELADRPLSQRAAEATQRLDDALGAPAPALDGSTPTILDGLTIKPIKPIEPIKPLVPPNPAGFVSLVVPMGGRTFAADDEHVYLAISLGPDSAMAVLRAWKVVSEGEGEWDDDAQTALVDVLLPLLEAMLAGIVPPEDWWP